MTTSDKKQALLQQVLDYNKSLDKPLPVLIIHQYFGKQYPKFSTDEICDIWLDLETAFLNDKIHISLAGYVDDPQKVEDFIEDYFCDNNGDEFYTCTPDFIRSQYLESIGTGDY